MKTPESYQYCVLRYMHDVRTEEVVNVAAVLFAPETQGLLFQRVRKVGRIKALFPDVDSRLVLRSVDRLEDAIRAALTLHCGTKRLDELVARVLPKDDSAFRWSPVSFGVAEDLEEAFSSIVRRFVDRYLIRHEHRTRTDSSVWKTIKEALTQKQAIHKIHRAVVQTRMRPHVFQHCWDNHRLHVIAPVSLDAESPEALADKASDWGGKLKDLARSSEDFRLHLVLGEPLQAALMPCMAEARAFLLDCMDTHRMEIRPEKDSEDIAQDVAVSSS